MIKILLSTLILTGFCIFLMFSTKKYLDFVNEHFTGITLRVLEFAILFLITLLYVLLNEGMRK